MHAFGSFIFCTHRRDIRRNIAAHRSISIYRRKPPFYGQWVGLSEGWREGACNVITVQLTSRSSGDAYVRQSATSVASHAIIGLRDLHVVCRLLEWRIESVDESCNYDGIASAVEVYVVEDAGWQLLSKRAVDTEFHLMCATTIQQLDKFVGFLTTFAGIMQLWHTTRLKFSTQWDTRSCSLTPTWNNIVAKSNLI